jgi:predicted nucleic acid-binding Zn ribbon protein
VEKAASLLSPLLKKLGVDEAVRLQQIRNDWQTLFEQPLSLHMSPSVLSEGDLLLSVDSPAWMQQLGFCKKDILKKLSGYGVRDLRFRIGRVSTKNRQKNHSRKAAELSSEETVFIADIVSGVDDEALRETIKKTIEKSLLSAKHRS